MKIWLDFVQNVFHKEFFLRESVLSFGYKLWKILRLIVLTEGTLNISICLAVTLCDLVELV